MEPCPFCEIVAGRAPAEVLLETPGALVIVPLGPVVPGHVLALPKRHVADFTEEVKPTLDAVYDAIMYARQHLGPCNLITSRGVEATQSVFHLHFHLVPRAENDGLALPWYSGKRKATVA